MSAQGGGWAPSLHTPRGEGRQCRPLLCRQAGWLQSGPAPRTVLLACCLRMWPREMPDPRQSPHTARLAISWRPASGRIDPVVSAKALEDLPGTPPEGWVESGHYRREAECAAPALPGCPPEGVGGQSQESGVDGCGIRHRSAGDPNVLLCVSAVASVLRAIVPLMGGLRATQGDRRRRGGSHAVG